mgnify:CR=1 FL=1
MYLEVRDLKKSYGENGSYVQVLKGINTEVEKGQMCVIQGTSGSGKSTLLNCIGGLDTAESGSIMVDGTEIVGMKQDMLSEYRRYLPVLQSGSESDRKGKYPGLRISDRTSAGYQ